MRVSCTKQWQKDTVYGFNPQNHLLYTSREDTPSARVVVAVCAVVGVSAVVASGTVEDPSPDGVVGSTVNGEARKDKNEYMQRYGIQFYRGRA